MDSRKKGTPRWNASAFDATQVARALLSGKSRRLCIQVERQDLPKQNEFSDWRLPSDATLSTRLEREEGIQPRALKSLVADIRESVAYLNDANSAVSATGSVTFKASVTAESVRAEGLSTQTLPDPPVASSTGLQTNPMPGGEAYVCLPQDYDEGRGDPYQAMDGEGNIPAIEFAGVLEEVKGS